MTKQEAAVISVFTGIIVGDFSDLHAYAEKIMGRPVWTHEFVNKEFFSELKERAKPDFNSICENIEG